jgi:hypothetical protein
LLTPAWHDSTVAATTAKMRLVRGSGRERGPDAGAVEEVAGRLIIMTALPGNTGYRFDGKIKLDELLAIGGAVSVASPKGIDPFRVNGFVVRRVA